jgi:4-aminobutyrate aminotransferase/(S)-3-amino-2-methylpropionate transaminase
MSSNSALQARRTAAIPRGVATAYPVFAERAEGSELWDKDGKRFIDFAGGIAVLNTGHRHPKVIAAVKKQLDAFTHTAFQIVPYEPYIELCERLNKIAPFSGEAKSILFSTGAEAVENAVKIARAATGRTNVIAFSGAFHGRTLMTSALTGKVAPYKKKFGPMPAGVWHVPFPVPQFGVSVADSLRAIDYLFRADVDPVNVAAIIIEPVQGEGGFIPMPPEFVQALRRICDEHGIVYVDDEVQSGCGRAGTLWAIEQLGVEPDLLVSGKTIGGGLPLAAVTGRTELMDAVHVGGLGGTFGGNPVACAAALAVLDELTAPGFAERAEQLGSFLRSRLEEIASRQSLVGEVRGLGPMLALELREPTPDAAKATTAAAFDKGLLLLACGLY